MLELFNEYKNSDKIAETLLVGKNMVNRYPQDERQGVKVGIRLGIVVEKIGKIGCIFHKKHLRR